MTSRAIVNGWPLGSGRPISTIVGFDFTLGGMPNGATLTRASQATRVNASRAIELVAADVPRFTYDLDTGELRGLLIEAASTNRLLQSAAFDAAAWSKLGLTATADASLAPDGSMTADNLVASAAGSTQRYVTSGTTFTAATWTGSVYLAMNGAIRYVQLYYGNTANSTDYANVDLQTGTVTASVGTAVVASAGPGWYRCRLTSLMNAVSQNFTVAAISSPSAARLANGTLNSGDTFAAWGAQLEQMPAPSSYIPTSGSAATRASDVLTLDWTIYGAAPGSTIAFRYTFDDNSVQDSSATLDGAGKMVVPTTLNRSRIRTVRLL